MTNIEKILNLFEKLSDVEKMDIISTLNEKTNNIMKIEYYGDDECTVYYFNKEYDGHLDEEYGWNFWESESNNLADEDTSFKGDIHNVNELKAYFEENIYIR